MLMLQYPLLPLLSLLCAVLAGLTVRHSHAWLTVCTALLGCALTLSALACMLPYSELLLLLLPPLLVCLVLLPKEDNA